MNALIFKFYSIETLDWHYYYHSQCYQSLIKSNQHWTTFEVNSDNENGLHHSRQNTMANLVS